MTTPHKATAKQWAQLEDRAADHEFFFISSCVAELRDRLSAAEQRIRELEYAENVRQQDEDAERASDGPDLKSLLSESTGWLVEYEASCQFSKEARKELQDLVNRCDAAVGDPLTEWDDDFQSTSNPSQIRSSAPAGELAERVAEAIGVISTAQSTARAAVHAVAEWFDAIGYGATASILRQELQRHG
jgi:hypothetical protein